jgi:hypothetical protein
MGDYPDIPACLDRRPRPIADGSSSKQQCNPPPTLGHKQALHTDAGTSNVGLRAKQSPAGDGEADKDFESEKTDTTVSDFRKGIAA